MAKDSSNPAPTSRRHHLSPAAVVSLQSYRAALARGADQRTAAEHAGLPRSTLQDLDRIPAGADQALDAWLRTKTGWGFVRKVVDAVLFTFHLVGGVGLPRVQEFLELTGLDAFVASSHGALHARAAAMRDRVTTLGETERARLGAEMLKPKDVILGLDETFFPSGTCLVAADLLSGFLLVESFAGARDRAAWEGAWTQGTRGLSLDVRSAVADGARGIRAFVEDTLGSTRAPDLFHVLNDVCKAFAVHLARREHAARAREEAARALHGDLRELQERRARETRRGRPVDFKSREHEARGLVASASREAQVAKERRAELRELLRRLSEAYMPVSLANGAWKSPSELEAELESLFSILDDLAQRSDMASHHLPYLAKAARCLPELVQALADFNSRVDQAVARKGLDADLARHFREVHLPAALLEERARLAPNREERRRIKALIADLRERLPRDIDALVDRELQDFARALAAHWQRTTSRIEGRNGHLSQFHHDGRGLCARKLACLTHIHNFHTRSAEGTTAAEKFFGKKHIDLARATLAGMEDLKRPRTSRQAA